MLHSVLTPEEKAKGNPYRKDNPLHRLYFHEIAQPDKITMRMKKLVEWLDEEETQHLHPVERAARAHYRFMSIYPWPKNSGKVARLLDEPHAAQGRLPAGRDPQHRAPALLRRAALRESAGLVPLVFESLENGVETSSRFFAELEDAKRGHKRAS